MRRHRFIEARERGETLLELVIAIVILGTCVVALGSGIALSVRISAIHRSQATADDVLHNFAEKLQGSTSYSACTSTTTPNYVPQLTPLMPTTGYTTPTVTVNYWVASTASFTTNHACPSTGDPGLQQVKVTLNSTGGLVSESVVVVLRQGS